MKSIKCPQCGFQNWETSEWCQQCKFILKSASINSPNAAAETPADFSGGQAKDARQNFHSTTDQTRREPPNAGWSSAANAGFVQKDGFLAKNIERCNRNLMIVCIAVIVSVAVGAFYNSRYLANVILGPAAVEQDSILFGGQDLPDTFRNYVKITADEVYDTGANYYEISDRNVKTIQSRYFLLDVEGKLLLAEIDPNSEITDGAKNVTLNGELANITAEESAKVTLPLLLKQPELRSDLLPFVLRAKSGFATAAYIGAAIGFALLLFAGFRLWSVLKKIGSPEESATMKSLAAHGSPAQVAASIDAEQAGQHEKISSIYLLPTWIIKSGTFSMDVQHVEDIVWMYKKVTKHSVNFIPTGKTYEVILHNAQGKTLSLTGRFMNDEKTNRILETIYRRVPWIMTGFDNELTAHWSKNKTAFIESVETRKKSYAEQFNQPKTAV
ncbi:MAG: hypothetical protein M3T96_00685 [Acidobacteriota bacterium]|nr:hypothetical protein [Acidobacteriota bacterium]